MRRWNDDPYTKRARQENYAARSVYKLEEIDKKGKFLAKARRILDLGAAPGSWTQLCLKRAPQAKVVAVDLHGLEVSHPNLTFIKGDIAEVDIAAALEGEKVDLVLSDMAPRTSGNASRDTALSCQLAELALDCARNHLRAGGTFVVKFFMGPDFDSFRAQLRESFGSVQIVRPDSTRKQSREIFFLATDFREES